MIGALLVAGLLTSAKPYGGTMLVYMGEITCGRWDELRGVAPGNYQKAPLLNYVLGFIAGRGRLRLDDPLNGVDAASVAAWVDNYCTANPLENVASAAEVLEVQLLARQSSR